MRKSAIAVGFAVVSSFSLTAMAASVEKTLNLKATISDPTSAFQVEAVSGSWPNTDQVITYNSSNGTFSNPGAIGFKVKSTQDVTVALNSTAKLVDGSKEIPIDVSITAQDTAKATSVAAVSLTGQKLYDKAKTTTGDYATYNLEVKANKTNMKDATGAIIPNTATAPGKPAAGNYTGTVDLVFESAI
ncbi:hypothetical protein [Pseudomonas caspiana]|uniref:Adhesin n=1 Tax=Pseudomonas caspiana TaxID=1451454 RepID=A0A1Y3NWC1_9PSED|nr:hypothetical protein [Pseudomonas caspiana]OUM71888.1 hypothetical protein AUC60_21435 [Pseudomonas caspiana]